MLTQRRKSEPEHWGHSMLAVQRPGLKQGYNAVRAFHKADAAVLRECVREVRYREKTSNTPGKARPPRHGNRPERDPGSQRLFLKRDRKPEYLRVDEAEAISLIPDQNGKTARAITVCGMTLRNHRRPRGHPERLPPGVPRPHERDDSTAHRVCSAPLQRDGTGTGWLRNNHLAVDRDAGRRLIPGVVGALRA